MKYKEFVPENYKKIPINWEMGLLKANLLGIGLFILAGIVTGIPFFLINTEITDSFRYDFAETASSIFYMPLHINILAFIGVIIIHEFLHALLYSRYCKHGFKSIKFGADAKKLVVYAACKEIIPTNKFIIGLIMPGVITGIVPNIVSIVTGSANLWLFSLVLIAVCIGDLYIFSQIYKDNKNTWFHNTAWLEPDAKSDMCLYIPKH